MAIALAAAPAIHQAFPTLYPESETSSSTSEVGGVQWGCVGAGVLMATAVITMDPALGAMAVFVYGSSC